MGPTTKSIGDALFGQTRQRVLSILFGRPDRRFFLNEIARSVGGKGAVHRELTQLRASGLILETIEGRQRYFQAAKNSPVFAELESLVRKSFGIVDVLRTALVPLAARIELAAVYGSMAQGSAHAGSDVDLLVIGDVGFAELIGSLASAQQSLGREINPTLFTADEWRRKVASGNSFARDVSSKPTMVVLGDLDEPGQSRSENRRPSSAATGSRRDSKTAQSSRRKSQGRKK